jgi:hypothetical protein
MSNTVEIDRLALATLADEVSEALKNCGRDYRETAAGYQLAEALDEAYSALDYEPKDEW